MEAINAPVQRREPWNKGKEVDPKLIGHRATGPLIAPSSRGNPLDADFLQCL